MKIDWTAVGILGGVLFVVGIVGICILPDGAARWAFLGVQILGCVVFLAAQVAVARSIGRNR